MNLIVTLVRVISAPVDLCTFLFVKRMGQGGWRKWIMIIGPWNPHSPPRKQPKKPAKIVQNRGRKWMVHGSYHRPQEHIVWWNLCWSHWKSPCWISGHQPPHDIQCQWHYGCHKKTNWVICVAPDSSGVRTSPRLQLVVFLLQRMLQYLFHTQIWPHFQSKTRF